jgi:hypothetical protein
MTMQQLNTENITAEMLLLPEPQRQTLAWMLEQGVVTFTELQAGTQAIEVDLRLILEDLIRRGFVEEMEIHETRHYRAALPSSQLTPTAEPGKPLAIILNSAGNDSVTPGTTFELGVTIRNKGNQSAVIDVFIDDLSPTLRQWCPCAQERLALGAKQSAEVVFRFQVPVDALPGNYNYLLIVDAPQHYPEDTPIRYAQKLQVLPPIQDTVRVSDPTFVVQPPTVSAKPAIAQLGGVLQFQIFVHNRGDRVDRFRLTCGDLPEDWINIIYPQGVQGQGLAVQSDSLDLNPGAQGTILMMVQLPMNALAGNYVPTLRLHSENSPNLALMDLVYFQVKPVYQVQAELQTIVSQVIKEPGLFAIQVSNQGNTPREIDLGITKLDGGKLCEYTLEPSHLKLQPYQTLSSQLWVQPIDPWKRPLFGGGKMLNFNVDLTDTEEIPLPKIPLRGFILWLSRPFWQTLPLSLIGLSGTLLLAFLIWSNFIRPPIAPRILKFAPEDTEYSAENGDFVRLQFQISNPEKLKGVEIWGQDEEGKVNSRIRAYDFSQGIPAPLRPFCLQIQQVLTCRNIRTDARLAGKYVFTLNLLPRDQRVIAATATSVPVAIAPIPLPEILEFTSTQPIYQQAPPKGQPPKPEPKTAKPKTLLPITKPPTDAQGSHPAHEVRLNWTIAHPKQIKAIQIVGLDAEGAETSPLKTYELTKGLPKELKNQCVLKETLVCKNIGTGDRQVGDHVFSITVIPKGEPPKEPIALNTPVIKIEPRPPQIFTFRVNGQEALPKYIIPVDQGQAIPGLIFSWQAENNEGTTIELSPAPGAVNAVGSIPFPLAPEPGTVVVTLKVTNVIGQEVTRSVTIETFDPTPDQSGAEKGAASGGTATAGGAGGGAGSSTSGNAHSLDTPKPTDERRLSPSELPPQFN